MITLKLPKTEVLFSNRPYSPKAINSLFSLVKNRSTPIGLILSADYQKSSIILFILENKPYASAKVLENGFESLAIRDFFVNLSKAEKPTLTLSAVNPVLFKCILVSVQKRPTTSGTSDLVNVEALLEQVKSSKRETVVTVRSGKDLNLFFFSNGKLTESCFAEPPSNPPDGTLEDQFLEFVYTAPSKSPVQLETFNDLKVNPAEDHDLEWDPSKEGLIDSFLRPRPELVFLSEGSVTKKTIIKKKLILGRGQKCDIHISDIKASREHAILSEVGGRYILEDLNSRNGTLVNNQSISKVTLLDGDEINIGKARILFKMDLSQETPSENEGTMDLETTQMGIANISGDSAVKEISLKLTNGPQKGIIIPLGKKLLIGRTKCDLNINDSKVSRNHATIEQDGSGYRFTDLKSTNGSEINDKPAKTKVLLPGDMIKIGETILQVIEKDSSS